MSLLFNMLFRSINFLSKEKHLLISWLQSPSAVILEPPKIKSVTVSTVTPLFYHEMKRRLLLGRKVYDQPRQHIKKQRHTLPTKAHLVKSMVFPVVMYGCESWTIEKAEHGRIDDFEL